jgi:Nitrate reductase gamma subunit
MAKRKRDYKREYRQRLARGKRLGLSRSAARGHARVGERPRPAGISTNPHGPEETGLKMMKRGTNSGCLSRLCRGLPAAVGVSQCLRLSPMRHSSRRGGAATPPSCNIAGERPIDQPKCRLFANARKRSIATGPKSRPSRMRRPANGQPADGERRCREYLNTLLFGIYPYICLVVLLIGSLIRFDQEPYTWKSDSSQMLRKRELRLGSNLFHYGVIVVILGHFVGFLAPHWMVDWALSPTGHQLLAMVVGGIAGLVAEALKERQ